MKAAAILTALISSASLLTAAEIPPDGFTLPNGMKIVVENGRVHVENAVKADGANSSVSSSVSVQSDGSGKSVATVKTVRNGVTETRTVTIGPDGKATVSEPADAAEEPAGAPAGSAKAWLGVNCTDVPPALRAQLDIEDGILVEHLAPGGPAAKAGLAQNDILLSLDRQSLRSVEDLRAKLTGMIPGQAVLLDYLHKGQRNTARATLSDRKEAGKEGNPTGAAMDDLATKQPKTKTQQRTTVVGPNGRATAVAGSGDDAFDALLNDPNVPESFKAEVRKQRDAMRKFQEDPFGSKPDKAKKDKKASD